MGLYIDGRTHGGNETTLLALYIRWPIWGSSSCRGLHAPQAYTVVRDALRIVLGFRAEAPPTADELEVAKHQGKRITQVAAPLKAAHRDQTQAHSVPRP